MLHIRHLTAFLSTSLMITACCSSTAEGRSRPLFYAPQQSIGCRSMEVAERFYNIRGHHTNDPLSRYHTIQQGLCQRIFPEEIWDRIAQHGNMVEVQGVSPSTVEHIRLFIPFSLLAALEPTETPVTSSTLLSENHPKKLPVPAFYTPRTLPADLPLWLLLFHTLWRAACSLYRRRHASRLIKELITTHREALFQRRRKLLTPDHYGAVSKDRWLKEIDYFCRTIIIPALQHHQLIYLWPLLEKKTHALIQTRTDIPASSPLIAPIFHPPPPTSPNTDDPYDVSRMEPLDYERFCAQLLQKAGWHTYLTPTGSDQGADIIATRRDIRLIVQCKLYSRPVGNRAVQEVFTACQHQRGNIAAVVSNAGYTRHARQLAESTGVHLLHHRQLSDLDETTPQPGRASFP